VLSLEGKGEESVEEEKVRGGGERGGTLRGGKTWGVGYSWWGEGGKEFSGGILRG